jgi:hypothetical protein
LGDRIKEERSVPRSAFHDEVKVASVGKLWNAQKSNLIVGFETNRTERPSSSIQRIEGIMYSLIGDGGGSLFVSSVVGRTGNELFGLTL